MGLRFEVTGLDEMIDRFDRLGSDRHAAAAAEAMDAHLAAGYAGTQAVLAKHVRTGRTAASGHVDSNFTGGEWNGHVSYGVEGPAGEHTTGARWLLAQGVDYLAPLGRTCEQVGEALNAYVRDTLEG